jgi:NADPH-dependent 2,4-dienoyl-CoA reductase/sulfur reductase-like enzyme
MSEPASESTGTVSVGRKPVGGYDVAVVGGGPAGLAAAAAASGAGARVVLLDSAPLPGGQYWRHRREHPPRDGDFARVAASLGRVDYRPGTSVWFVEPGYTLHTGGGPVTAERVVLATGAHDRVVPFPGWDLPGVLTAGAAQALLKGHGVLPGRRIVVAGTGPFLLPVATALAGAGAKLVGVFEANHPLRLATRMRAGALLEAGRYAAGLVRHRIPYRTGHTVVAAHGEDEVNAVTVAGPGGPGGRTRRIACDTLAVGFGFVPALELATLLGCATHRDGDGNLVVTVDAAQRTSVPGIAAAGEITGVGGAELAQVEGAIAGGRPTGELVRRRARLRRFAAALHAAFPVPAGWPDALAEDTVVCRCEEVRFNAVREAVTELGATDARTVKLLTRTGMGWCQGRMCGFATACLAARLNGREPTEADLSAFAHRPFGAPVTLGELAEERLSAPGRTSD